MADYITIDGGTTNTRISLVQNDQVVDTRKFSVGARKGITDKTLLKETVKQGIGEILSKHGMRESGITRILASGMITSEFGLVSLPHIPAPAGIAELHSSMYETVLEDISEIPFAFIRGVKTGGATLEDSDMMRGEETELMGISDCPEGIFILPGSHSKIIQTDNCGRIVHFKTMLTGEMIAALSEGTILKDAVDLGVHTLHTEYLVKGFAYALRNGMNEALFKVRILKNVFGRNPAEIYSFYMGVILCDEIRYILSQNAPQITIGGKQAVKKPMAVLLKEYTKTQITEIPEALADNASALGAIRIFEYKGDE